MQATVPTAVPRPVIASAVSCSLETSFASPRSLVVTYDPTKPNNCGINLENYGVAPDVWVENTPEDELNGFDRELKTAVDEALRMMKERKWQFTTEAEGAAPKGGSR
jgi:tricorn protease